MRAPTILLLLLMVTTAQSRPLSTSEHAVLTDWRAGPAQLLRAEQLAAQLGRDGNMEATETLIEARSRILMGRFVEAIQLNRVTRVVTPAEESRAIQLARDESYDSDSESAAVRDQYFRLLQGYRSTELFDIFYFYAREELTARQSGHAPNSMHLPRWYGPDKLTMAQVPDMDARIASLLPLLPDACDGYTLLTYFERHLYPPAFDSLRELYLRSGMSRRDACTHLILHQFVAMQTRPATEAMARRILWLADQPASKDRDWEIRTTVLSLGPIRAAAQVNYTALKQELMAKPLSAELRGQLDADFEQSMSTAQQAREYTPENLDFWIDRGNAGLVADFLQHGVRATGTNAHGKTRVGDAIARSELQIAGMLLEAGGEFQQGDFSALCQLPDAAFISRKVSIESLVTLFIARGGDLNGTDARGLAPLHYAATDSTVHTLALLVAQGANSGVRVTAPYGPGTDSLESMQGATPLHFAARGHQLGAANFLLAHGVDVNAQTVHHATPLLFAAAFADAPIVKLLIDNGANVRQVAENGVSPILVAHERGYTQIETLLASHGATLDLVTLLKRKAARAFLDAYASGMK